MKNKHIMKNRQRFEGKIKPLAAAAVLLCSAYTQAAYEFAATPLYLQNETKVTQQPAVKHNVMLFIDDSGSMGDYVGNSGKTRMKTTQDVLNTILGEYKNKFNWSLQTLHNNNSVNYGGYTDDYSKIQSSVNRLRANGGTPTTRRYYELVSDIVMPATEYRCQKSYVVVMSDGDANLSCRTREYRNSPAVPFTYPAGKAYDSYFGTSPYLGVDPADRSDDATGARVAGTCQYIPGGSYSTTWDQGNGLAFFSRKLSEVDFRTSGLDKAGKSWQGDDADPKDANGVSQYRKQLVNTYTIGFAGMTSRGEKYLDNAATGGKHISASNESELLAAFNSIFDNISTDSAFTPYAGTGGTAPATTGSGIPDMAATVHLNTGSWSSQLRFYRIKSDGTADKAATPLQPSFGNRKTLINDGVRTRVVDGRLEMSNADFAISGGSPADDQEWKMALIPWTVRTGSNDESIQNLAKSRNYSQTYRLRTAGEGETDERNLGDILGGSVATIGDKVNNRQEFLVAAANDGMVHMFKSAAGRSPYDLTLSYIPAGMERDADSGEGSTTLGKVLKDVANANYGSNVPHRYMVNGGFVLRRSPLNNSGNRQTFMFGAMGQGGRGAYALNLGALNESNSTDTWAGSVPLFETAKGENNKLGYTIGSPQIGRVSVKRNANQTASVEENVRYAGFLGSGYRYKEPTAAGNETALYVYNMLGVEAGTGANNGNAAGSKGEVLAKITVSGGVGGLSEPTLVDTDFDGLVDVAYAGDRGGNMYRFDLRGQTPGEWKVSMIYQGNPSQPITSAPAVSRRSKNKYVVIFGTGQDIYQDDLTNKNRQAVYGIYDDLDKEGSRAGGSELQVQTMTVRDGLIYLSNEAVDSNKKGWTFNLPGEGERVVVKPTMLLRTAVITTRKYQTVTDKVVSDGDKCMPERESIKTQSSSSLIGVNAENGGALGVRSARFTGEKTRVNINGGTYYANGRQYNGIISSTFIDGLKLNDSPVTADGDSGGNGTDGELTTLGNVPTNRCFRRSSSNVRSLLLNTLESLEVNGPACGLRRISWREIF